MSMREFVLLFRMNVVDDDAQPTPEQMRTYMAQWMAWIEGIASKGNLAEGGHHLSRTGTVLRPGKVVEDGPYVAECQSVAGYVVVQARDLKSAVKIAEKCPILDGEGTSVEVREAGSPG